ncbi:hypothetical protein Nepgr_028750 [Nepenthes gracilis]|uniref:non-specific serine/threonine protein kinase n=1 Tax=Nepenthes gracilis TaxID=150966 RepID=A0AAD3Y2E0_NEPGR|nr:hypothetical protein Nepgr_028750 [Nepenthes gracilis]
MGRWRARAAPTLLHSPVLLSCFLLLFNFRSFLSAASDTLTLEESLSINQTLVSVGQTFELGFFTSANRKKWYVGIWYKNLPTKTIVWVANRDAPVWSSSASLKLGDHANIVILDQGSSIRWSSNQSQATNPIIQLLNTGNLVVREMFDESPERYIWQSFDHPTDTLLPGQKLGWNLRTGLDRYLTSWRGVNDPSSGNFSCKLDPRGGPEMFLWNGNSGIIWESGPWSGHNFLGMPNFSSVFEFTLFANEDEVYYMFQVLDDSVKSRLMVDPNGVARRYNWVPNSSVWNLYWSEPEDQCDDYNKCGSFGFCNASALFVCQCLQGFEPKNQQAWALRVGSDGCERKTKLECQSDGFQMFENMKVPRTSEAFVNRSISVEDCESLCRKDCNCTAYASSDVDDGVWSGCVIWSGDLINMRNYVQGGQNLYVRLAASDLVGNTSSEKGSKNTKKMMIRGSIAFGLGILLFPAGCIIWKRKTLQTMRKRKLQKKSRWEFSVEANTEELELPLFDLDTIAMATDNFSSENELGQGGFGCVYKAMLVEGEELAVKRLSKNSGQGSEEFKNEVKLIAKLQHRNLVRLLGCCVERDEKIIIYEYLPNRSLDCFLFNEERSSLLNWQRRFDIICGVAQGLVYLHRDSIFRIIHRDLKASNILLDAEMQPKISDFGMARIFRGMRPKQATQEE